MTAPRSAEVWAKEIPRTCLHEPMHGQDNTVRVCYRCLRIGLERFAAQEMATLVDANLTLLEQVAALRAEVERQAEEIAKERYE